MTTNEYAQYILLSKKDQITMNHVDEKSVCEVAGLISGDFTYLLYEALWMNFFDMNSITRHLENLFDSKNHFGLVYFIFILANSIDFIIPVQFADMSSQDELVPYLSSAIIEDWLEYHNTHEETENIVLK